MKIKVRGFKKVVMEKLTFEPCFRSGYNVEKQSSEDGRHGWMCYINLNKVSTYYVPETMEYKKLSAGRRAYAYLGYICSWFSGGMLSILNANRQLSTTVKGEEKT